MVLSYADVEGISAVSAAFNQTYNATGLPPNTAVQSLSDNLLGFAYGLPSLAVIGSILLVVESFMLSFFIKSSPLAAVYAICLLFIMTIASFYLSNEAIVVLRLGIFTPLIAANPLVGLWFINLPPILVICCVLDIGIAFTSARN